MKFRLASLAGLLVTVLLLALAADAQTVYVRNRPFPDRVSIGGTTFVPAEELLRALRLDWSAQEDGSLVVRPGSGLGQPIQNQSFLLRCGERSLIVEGLTRGSAVWVPLRPVAETLGFTVTYTPSTDILDVVAARPISAADEAAAAEVAAAAAAREQAIQEAWNKRREAIQAERKAREEAEAAKAAEAGQAGEAAAGQAPAPGGGEGTFPPEMAGQPSGAAKPAPAPESGAPAEAAAPAPEAAPSPSPAASPAPPPKPAEALLIVVNPLAVPDYYTGNVRITARIQNNGEADASNVVANITLLGPDGSVWNRQTKYYDRIKVDDSWNLETSWRHLQGNAMPRGVPTVTVDLDYKKN